ncbi:MAG TPA: lysophospholipid acyltransferase family protein [Candidatus Dormibacteraeota bacterium]|jgi:KDO2-lipid IV(A) lauroyltransferase|nr:lysophospholipid acyltransferase family protein [Candidatus Dormibacteraeota bacterium]
MPEQVRRPSAAMRSGMHAAVALSRALGPLRYPVADSVAMCVYALDPKRRHNAARNHRRLDPAIGDREAKRRARQSFREYGRTTADFIWANGMDDEEVRRHSVVHGLEHLEAARAAGRGGVITLSHYGNWDMGATAATARGTPLTTVMAPLGPQGFTDLVIWMRQRQQLEVYTPQNAARGLLRALRKNRIVGLLSDIPGAGPTVEVDYCGGRVPFSAVPAWLALRTGAPLLPADSTRRHGAMFEIVVHPPVQVCEGDDERAIMQRVAHVLEQAVLRRPAQWYPFGDVYTDARDAGPPAR